MIGSLFKFWKKRTVPVTTIPLEELANLWRDPIAPEEVIKKENHPKPRPKNEPNESEASAVDLTALIGKDRKSPVNNNDPWFDKTALLSVLQSRISNGRTSAFVYRGTAYYTLETVFKALNEQRRHHRREPLDPPAVITFFKSKNGTERGLSSGKYLLRFDKGLPVKIYLYTHPVTGEKSSGLALPVDETGRRLKSLNPVKGRTP